MLKIATIMDNENNNRFGLYYSNNSLYFKTNENMVVIPDSQCNGEGWLTNLDTAIKFVQDSYSNPAWKLDWNEKIFS